MPRLGSLYPIVFGSTLVVLAVAFHGRRWLFPEVFEEQRRRAIEGRRQSQEIKSVVAEGLRKEREKRGSN